MEFTNTPKFREPVPSIELVALVEHGDKKYLGWVKGDFQEEDIVQIYDSFEVILRPVDMSKYRGDTVFDEGLKGDISIVLPGHDLPLIRAFGSYDTIQVFGIEAALHHMYVAARDKLTAMKSTLQTSVIRKEKQTNGTHR